MKSLVTSWRRPIGRIKYGKAFISEICFVLPNSCCTLYGGRNPRWVNRQQLKVWFGFQPEGLLLAQPSGSRTGKFDAMRLFGATQPNGNFLGSRPPRYR
ncbi:hypothetical protein BQ8482_360070 [Mesorhizobium delmotii]|uniref:Uncharacterized protein n=1 Tax=Mesorhizobium delmotii TaxID=1631247 RepID=A0A2P9AR98_9HYPH|nr:hypothetical protein BQ8482_360070 [Mesorhizobium delmotii]